MRRKKLIISDIDGTLTDGGILIDKKGRQLRTFHIRDVLGISYWRNCGFQFGIITGDGSSATKHQAKMMNADYIYLNCMKKKKAIMEILDRGSLVPSDVAYIGDDLIDISALKTAGLAVVPSNGSPELDQFTHYRTKANGGEGAVREVVELILKSKGIWEKIVLSNSQN